MNRTVASRLYAGVPGYFRLVVPERHPVSRQLAGVFAAAHRLRRDGAVSRFARDEIEEMLDWFGRNLPAPGSVRNRAIFWFKGTRNPCSRRIWALV